MTKQDKPELRLEDWKAIVDAAIEDAKTGDAAARTWLTAVAARDVFLRKLAGLPTGATLEEILADFGKAV